MTTSKVPVRFFDVLPAALLTGAHVLACFALVRFWQNVGEFPLAPTGMLLYLLATVGSVVAMGLLLSGYGPHKLASRLLAIFMPLIACKTLAISLYLTSRWGGAQYSPYDPFDDFLPVLFIMYVAAFVGVAVWYKSKRFLVYGAIAQLIFSTMLLFSAGFPEFGYLVFYVLGLFGLRSSAESLDFFDNRASGFLPASMASALLGTFVFHISFGQFPENGMSLGWVNANTMVPLDAWNAVRPIALSVSSISLIAIAVGMVCVFGRIIDKSP